MALETYRQKFFARLFSWMGQAYDDNLNDEKLILFEKLRQQKPHNPNGTFRIVELGAGQGTNLKYFPKNCSLLVIDPNPYFESNFRKNLEQRPDINFEGYITAYGEDMKEYVEDESVDAVVVTAVFCSVIEVQQVLKEIQRILVPGGRFYYLEHILGKKGTFIYYKQKIVAFTRIWSFVGCDCQIDRNFDVAVTKAGFSNVEQKLFDMTTSGCILFHLVYPHVAGMASK